MWEKIERSTIIGLYCSISPQDCDELMALKAQAEADAQRNSQLRVELEQVKKVANDQAQLAAQLKSIVLQLHNAATCDTPLDDSYKLLSVQEVFNSYPMLAEWLGESE